MKTILVTGGAGFIGSHLSEKLLEKNNRIICIDNFNNFYNSDFKKENVQTIIKNKNFLLYKADIRKISELRKIFVKHKTIDSIVHLAARAGVRPSIEKPLLYERVNILGTYNLLTLSVKQKIKQFIFASSSSVYGDSPTPFSEDETRLKPLSPYGATKIAGEYACFTFHKNFGLPVTILRFFSVYGPRGRPDMAPYLFTNSIFHNRSVSLFGDGNSSRDWTYIDDIIEGINKVIQAEFEFEIFNLGNSKPIRLSELLKTIETITGRKFRKKILPKRIEEPQATYASVDKAKKILNWHPKTQFNEGMKQFIKWYIDFRN